MTVKAPGVGNRSGRDGKGFVRFFRQATGFVPYPYQLRMALSPDLPRLVKVHTGAGKTAAIVLAWLWRRRFAPTEVRKATPRRLVFCLPMRVLVEQTRENVVGWLFNLGLLGGRAEIDDSGRQDRVVRYEPTWDSQDSIAVSVLMGGGDRDGWDIHPERDAVIIGTQDMLLSRALNRGFGMSRYRWPLQFGLLNNDCLWVFDEARLMGEGLPTTAQLQAFRDRFGHAGPAITVWMSSTLEPGWLKTVDFDFVCERLETVSLREEDRGSAILERRLTAKKPVERAGKAAGDPSVASDMISAHRPGTRTLAVVNTVERALALYAALAKRRPAANLVLVHSRFRPPDRKKAIDRLLGEPGKVGVIAVSTQVIEAGFDVSARVLFTELAPWESLVLRFGRCNRTGAEVGPRIFWMDLPANLERARRMARPYALEELLRAKEALAGVFDASPSGLPEVPMPRRETQFIRKKDLVELFDTTPDILGRDVDISRFIRDDPGTDVSVFWRDLPPEGPAPFDRFPGREDLCPVPVVEIRELVAGRCVEAWAPDQLDGAWMPLTPKTPVFPGMTVMLRSQAGMYTAEAGWDRKSLLTVPPVAAETHKDSASYDEDRLAQTGWAGIAEHSDDVAGAMRAITSDIDAAGPWLPALLEAARWHDAGKAHPAFQAKLKAEGLAQFKGGHAAKAPENAWLPPLRHDSERGDGRRFHFRHELVSGLLALQAGKDDLVAYLAAAHHGKVRMSIRPLPDEWRPPQEGLRFARGVWDGDRLGSVDLGEGVKVSPTRIDLSVMELGEGAFGPSWTARVLALRDRPGLGIFRLAFLEALVKAADERASGGTV